MQKETQEQYTGNKLDYLSRGVGGDSKKQWGSKGTLL